MSGLFEGYKIALLDSSFFMNPFPQDVQDGLREIKVYVSDTFNSEIEQYKIILSQTKCSYYDANISFLNQNMQLNTLNLGSFGEKSECLHNDVWGLITLFKSVNPNAKIVVVTANKLLIQRIVLHNIQIDIYDLNDNCFIRYDNAAALKSQFEFKEVTWANEPRQEDRATKGTRLYRNDGSVVVLGDVIKSGLESNLHKVEGTTNLIAKVFKKEKLSAKKLKNLKKLAGVNDKLEISWALFPIDILYFDKECKFPVGFTEGFAFVDKDLSDNPLFAGQLEDLPDYCLNTHLSTNIELCIKVVRQVCYLNNFGFFVSDYNLGNFATIRNDDKYIQMWDTDSFGYDTFFSGYCSGDKTTKEYDISTKESAIDFCSEALYLFAFSLLSLGDSPMSEFSGKFKYDNPNYIALYRIRLFPQNLWQLFHDVFTGKKLPSAETLLRQLSLALENFKRSPAEDHTYGELLEDIIPPKTQPVQPTSPQGQQQTPSNQQQHVPTNEWTPTPPAQPQPKKGLPGWAIALIVAGAIILIAIIKGIGG